MDMNWLCIGPIFSVRKDLAAAETHGCAISSQQRRPQKIENVELLLLQDHNNKEPFLQTRDAKFCLFPAHENEPNRSSTMKQNEKAINVQK